jgi:hypothetical protein
MWCGEQGCRPVHQRHRQMTCAQNEDNS